MLTTIVYEDARPSVELLLDCALLVVQRVFGRCQRCGFTPEDIAGEAVSDALRKFNSSLNVPLGAYVRTRAAWLAGEYNRKLKRPKYSGDHAVDHREYHEQVSHRNDPLTILIAAETIRLREVSSSMAVHDPELVI